MDMIEKILRELDDKTRNNIYLHEIALLMEEIETLKEKLEVRENLLKNYEKQLSNEKEYRKLKKKESK